MSCFLILPQLPKNINLNSQNMISKTEFDVLSNGAEIIYNFLSIGNAVFVNFKVKKLEFPMYGKIKY